MKILTLTQPWATLVMLGAKRVETRSWATEYRGSLGIHAAKGFPREAIELCFREPFATWLKKVITKPSDLPRGELLCVAHLQACVPTKNVLEWISEHERAFGDYADGRYAWVFGAPPPFRLERPIPCRGSLGLWTPPLDIVGQLAAQGIT